MVKRIGFGRLFWGLLLIIGLSPSPGLANNESVMTDTTASNQDLPTVVENIWLNEEDLPWSTPVWVRTEDDRRYLAVIDRDYTDAMNVDDVKEPGILTVWSPEQLLVYGAIMNRSCFTIVFVPVCKTHFHPIAVSGVQVKIGEQIYRLGGSNSQFVINPPLAQHLRKASLQSIPVMVRIVAAGTGNRVTRPIGSGTVEAWQTVYQASPASPKTEAIANTGQSIPSSAVPSSKVPTIPNQSNLPTVNEEQWRSNGNLPWSVPVLIVDNFAENYVAVLDRDSNEGFLVEEVTGLVTNWGMQRLQIHPFRQTPTSYLALPVDQITLNLGQKSINLQGVDNEFLIDPELARLLYNAQPGEVNLSYQDAKGNVITHPIGNQTIESWKTLYQGVIAKPPSTSPSSPSSSNLLPQKP